MKISFRSRKTAQMGLIALLCISSAFAAFDAFLQIDGIDGESTDKDHKDWIQTLSFSWGVGQAATTVSPIASGKATFQPITITKPVDKGSTKLYEACASGKHIPKLTLELTRAAKESREKYLKFVLTDVVVTSVKIPEQTTDSFPLEQVTFNYSKIEWAYTSPQQTIYTGGWDVQLNKLLPSAILPPTPIPDQPTAPGA